jgi:hypothetical protein
MGSSLLSSTEKKEETTVVAGSSATIINQPSVESKEQPTKEAPGVTVQNQTPVITTKASVPQPKEPVTTINESQPKPTVTQPDTTAPTVKKPVIMVQTPKKPQPVHQEPVAEKETPQSQAQPEEPQDDGVVMEVKLVKKASNVLSKVVPKHSSISVLGYVKIESFDSRLRLMGTDLEKSLIIEVPYTNKIERLKSPLAISLEDLKRLSKVKASELRFGRENGNILVSYTGERGLRNEVIRKMDPTEFPEIPLPKGVFIPVKGLGLAISEACRFCSEEITRFAITGILLTKGEVVASDGKRLYRRFVPELQQEPKILIPNSLTMCHSVLSPELGRANPLINTPLPVRVRTQTGQDKKHRHLPAGRGGIAKYREVKRFTGKALPNPAPYSQEPF